MLPRLPEVGRRRAAQTFRSLRTPNFRRYVAAQLASTTGLAMQQVGQAWLVLELTGSGVSLGATVALQFLPLMVLGPWAGFLADRSDKRRLLLATQGAAGALALVLWALTATGMVTVTLVYLLALATGLTQALDLPARHAFVIEMVGPTDVANAVALNSATFNAGRLLGPAAAGLLIAAVGTAACFLLNAVSYLPVLAALARMDTEALHRQAPVPRAAGAVRAGLRHVWATPELRLPLAMVAVVGTLGFNFVVVLPLLARQTLGGGPALYGSLTALVGLGSLVGALGAASRARPTTTVLLGAATAFGVLMVAAAAARHPLVLGALLVGVGLSVMVFLSTANASLQLASEPAMRGRVMALYALVFLGSTPVGGPLVGWISERWGPPAGLATGGVASLGAVAVAVLRSRRRLGTPRRFRTPRPAPEPEPAPPEVAPGP